jgi:galactose mutarotase-like enzyme
LLEIDITLVERTLTVRTTVTPTTNVSVPLCYGYHPYLQLPDSPRAQWKVETPAMRLRPVNAWGIPTGEGAAHPATTQTLGDTFLDDGYDEVPGGAVFAVSGGKRRIEVHFVKGFTAAQVFAPADDDVICFEPMAAPTDALRRGGYRMAKPGEPDTSEFAIKLS